MNPWKNQRRKTGGGSNEEKEKDKCSILRFSTTWKPFTNQSHKNTFFE